MKPQQPSIHRLAVGFGRALLAMSAAGLAACTAPLAMPTPPGTRTPPATSTDSASAPAALIATPWVGRELPGAPLVDGSRLTLRFDASGRVAANAGCNRLSAAYRLEADRLQVVPPIISTRMACAPALMEQETRFLALLGAVSRYGIDGSGALVLTTTEGASLRLAPEPPPSR